MRTKRLLAIVTVLTMVVTLLSGLTMASADLVSMTVQYDGIDGLFTSTTAEGFTFTLNNGDFGTAYTDRYNEAILSTTRSDLKLLTTTGTDKNLACSAEATHVHPSYTVTAPEGAVIKSYSVVVVGCYDGGSATCGTETWSASTIGSGDSPQSLAPNLYAMDVNAGSYSDVKTEPTSYIRHIGQRGVAEDTAHASEGLYGQVHFDCKASGIEVSGESRGSIATWTGLNAKSIKITLPKCTSKSGDTKLPAYGFQTIGYDMEVVAAGASLKANGLPAGGNKFEIEFTKAMNPLTASDITVAGPASAVKVLGVEMSSDAKTALVTLDTTFVAGDSYSINLAQGLETIDEEVVTDTFFMLEIAPAEGTVKIYNQPMTQAGIAPNTNANLVSQKGFVHGKIGSHVKAENIRIDGSVKDYAELVYAFGGDIKEFAFISTVRSSGDWQNSDKNWYYALSADGTTWTEEAKVPDTWKEYYTGTYITIPEYSSTNDYNASSDETDVWTLSDITSGYKYLKIKGYPTGGMPDSNSNIFNLQVAYDIGSTTPAVATPVVSSNEYIEVENANTVHYYANVTKNGMGAVIVAVAYDNDGNILGIKVGSQLDAGPNSVDMVIDTNGNGSDTDRVKAYYFESLSDIKPLLEPVSATE